MSRAYKINKAIIDLIINSPLNIQSIPDDIEIEMYTKILEIIEENPNCMDKLLKYISKLGASLRLV